jgi:ribosomal-protein-alanine N-acetyltransferase
VISLVLKPLKTELLSAALALDLQCLGGLWSLEGYQREINSPTSELLALTGPGSLSPKKGDLNRSLTGSEWQFPTESLLGMGCFWSILSEAHVTLLAVHPDYQGQGLGRALLHGLLSIARQRGLEQATLEVRVSNHPALALYDKFGFQKAGRRRRYYPDTGEDGLILWRSGLQSSEFEQSLSQCQQQIEIRLAQAGWLLHRTDIYQKSL